MQKANRRPVYSRHVLNQVQVKQLLPIIAEREFPQLKIQFDANVKWLLLGVLRAMFGCDARLLRRGMGHHLINADEILNSGGFYDDKVRRFSDLRVQICLEAMLINTLRNNWLWLTNGRRLTLKQSMKMALRVFGHINHLHGLSIPVMEKHAEHAEKVREQHQLSTIDSAIRPAVEVYLRRVTDKLDKATARGSWFLAGALDYYAEFLRNEYDEFVTTPKRKSEPNPYEQDLFKNWAETYQIEEYDVRFALDVILKCAVDANLLRNRPNRPAIILKEIDFEIAIHYLALFAGQVLIRGLKDGQKLAREHFSRRS